MSLENVFYTLAIIYMVFGLIISVALVVAVFYIKSKIDVIQANIEEQLARIKNSPGDFAMDIGSAVAASAIKAVKKKITG